MPRRRAPALLRAARRDDVRAKGGAEGSSRGSDRRPSRARARAEARLRRASRARCGAELPREGRRPVPRPGRSRAAASCQLPLEQVGQARERAARARLHGAERDVEVLRDLALGDLAPVGELETLALLLRRLFQGAMYTP